MKRALIDGDILVYRCGFAAQHNEYTLHASDGDKQVFRYKRELDKFVKENNITDVEVSKALIVQPESHALQNCKTTIMNILAVLDTKDCSIYLTGKGNFRIEAAITQGYKANRDPLNKPVHYHAVKGYLVDTWKALICNGVEADDLLASEQTTDTVICTTDKDLDQVVGAHFNWVKDEMYYVDEVEAEKFLWTQMLTGDSTDNIRGIPGLGKVKAKKYLDAFDLHEYPDAVLNKFEDVYGEEGEVVYNEHIALIKLGVPEDWDYDTNVETVYTGSDLGSTSRAAVG